MARALQTSGQHEDPQTRERATTRARKWSDVIAGMASGLLDIGSRLPLAKVPAWVTLEVVTGGFATGAKAAGGDLQPHELALLERLGLNDAKQPRQAINLYYLTRDGLNELREMLSSGCYQVAVPEEAALLVVTFLVDSGLQNEAMELVNQLEPFFAELRFYPAVTQQPLFSGDRVHLESVGDVMGRLDKFADRRRILEQNETLNVWIPLYDEFVLLVADSVTGDLPSLAADADGQPLPQNDPQCDVLGGIPFQSVDENWKNRAETLLQQYESLRLTHQWCRKPERRGENFHDLRALVTKAVAGKLKQADIQRARTILARDAAKRGPVGSERRMTLRQRQARDGALPTHGQVAQILVQRLKSYASEGGLEDPDRVLDINLSTDVGDGAGRTKRELPKSMVRKVNRALHAPIDDLVRCGVITSGDVLARLLPQVSARVMSGSFDDPRLKTLFQNLYRSFRKRRSLLLLQLQKQVQLHELPWAGAIERFGATGQQTQQQSMQTLVEMARLALKSFPQAIVPNKLLQEFRALAKSADLDLPLLDELAADIFEGAFTVKFLKAAHLADEQLEGTIYAQYYELSTDALPALPDKKTHVAKGVDDVPARRRSHIAQGFAELCAGRAGTNVRSWSVAENGRVIEQQQILTTQNLAALMSLPGLADQLHGDLIDMSGRCFDWICRQLATNDHHPHSRLIKIKNCAYAWRQMLFFLSHAGDGATAEFLPWMRQRLGQTNPVLREQLSAAVLGLELVAAGGRIEADSAAERFLGWSSGRHWLMSDWDS